MTRNTAINIVRKDSSKTDEHCLFSDTIFFDRKNGLERLSSLESSTGSINGNPYYRKWFNFDPVSKCRNFDPKHPFFGQNLEFQQKNNFSGKKSIFDWNLAFFEKWIKIESEKVLTAIPWAVPTIPVYVHRRTFQLPVILVTFPISNMKNHLAENQNHR